MSQNRNIPNQTLVMLVGPPASGKSTIAKIIVPRLNVAHWDIDDVRAHFFGVPPANDGTDPVIKARDDREMAGTYNILLGVIDGFLRAEHPLLLTCTLSSKKWGQDRVKAIYEQYPNARVRIIWCCPELTLEELHQRIQERAATGYVGATQDMKRAWELRNKYEPIALPHLKLDTGPAHVQKASAEEALNYVIYPQPHDMLI